MAVITTTQIHVMRAIMRRDRARAYGAWAAMVPMAALALSEAPGWARGVGAVYAIGFWIAGTVCWIAAEKTDEYLAGALQ